ncbi:MAG: IS3 family transposase, partial [Syntrophobacteraceae bacterium]
MEGKRYSEEQIVRGLEGLRSDRGKDVVERITAVKKHPRYGCPKVHAELRRQGFIINHKSVHRLWKQEGFHVRKRKARKRQYGPTQERVHKAER